MERLKCLIVDDEQRAVNTMVYLIEHYCGHLARVTQTASDITEAGQKILTEEPDVLFLDLKLGEEDGFKLLEQLGDKEKMQVVIVTAYNAFALEAFTYNVVNYLLKPVNYEELLKVMQKMYGYKQLLFSYPLKAAAVSVKKRIFLPDRNGWNSFPLEDIVCLEADNVYTNIHMTGGRKELISKHLGFIQNQYLLYNKEFVRVQKSFITNARHVVRINNNVKCTLLMSNGMEVPVSSNMKKKVFDMFLNED